MHSQTLECIANHLNAQPNRLHIPEHYMFGEAKALRHLSMRQQADLFFLATFDVCQCLGGRGSTRALRVDLSKQRLVGVLGSKLKNRRLQGKGEKRT